MEGKLALWQVIARILNQSSRLSSVRLADTYAVCDIVGIKQEFNEETLYKNLNWIFENQIKIESKLFKLRNKREKARIIFV